MTGLAYNITTGLSYVLREVQHIISLVYGQDPCLAHVMVCATAQAVEAQGFLTEFVKFIDETYEQLVSGGNPPVDLWWIITRVIQRVFVDYLSSARAVAVNAGFRDHLHEASMKIWSVLRCNAAAKSMQSKGIGSHATVIGAYSQWLVTHSGRKEADDARKVAEEAKKLLNQTRTELTNVKMTATNAKALAETAKKTADKALAKANSS